jgi:ketosteroid isomerase-like protein
MSQENVEIVRGVRIALSPLSERASQRRTLDERLYVRFPALYRRFAERVTQLPLGSRVRRLVLTRVIRRFTAAINRRDFEVVFLGLDPGIEYRPSADLMPPDFEAVSHGHGGYREGLRQLIDSFEDLRAEPKEVFDFGDRLVAITQFGGHGSGSGVPVNLTTFALVKLRRGLVVWQKDFSDRSKALEAAAQREEALEAAGLRE